MNKEVLVKKANGELVVFSRDKLEQSMIRAGAADSIAEEITDLIVRELQPGMSTQTIYKRAFDLLKRRSVPAAGRYKLKNAIMELGPSGYPFETLISQIFHRAGFRTETGRIVQGQCISHEIDVWMEKKDHSEIMECKFRNRAGDKIDAKITLYVYSRFLDVKEGTTHLKKPVTGIWLVTNTRFSSDSIDFGKCRGMNLLGWNYPHGKSIRDLIDKHGLHPITCLSRLKKKEKKALLEHQLVLAHQLRENEQKVARLLGDPRRVKRVLQEAEDICGCKTT